MTTIQLECGFDAPILTTEYPVFPLDIGGLHFTDKARDAADWLVAYYDRKEPIPTRVPRSRRILVLTEPGADLPAGFVNQFGILVAPQEIGGFNGVWVQNHGALPYGFGRDVSRQGFPSIYDYAALQSLEPPEKRDAVAVVVSRKTLFPGHRRRLRFLKALKAALNERLDLFGDGLNKIPIKADAILPYKYHLALENTVMPSYWTEKLADAYLGYALPIVSGPPDLARWFPEESFLRIDLERPEAAISAIEAALDGNLYAERLPAIREARSRLMENERLCPLIARVIAAHPDETPRLAAPELIQPMSKKPLPKRIAREIGRAVWRLDPRLRM